ncbi:MAG: amidohydrolase family protein [Ferruginibacter sp.]
MLLTNVRLVPGKTLVDIAIQGETISNVSQHNLHNKRDEFAIDFENAIAFPGLINSHDHLDFNCFPMLGKGDYKNYTQWGNDIHERYKQEINAVLKIPVALRTSWGIYKNLLAGVTTVVNHGDVLKIEEDPLITVKQELQNLHSVGFQKKWKWKLNDPFKMNTNCVIHVGEGTDERSEDEIDELIKWNLLRRKLIGIHAVAMNSYQAKKFSAIVWCPESNKFLLNKTADVKILKNHTKLLFGTDSTLTGNWNVWQHLRLARDTQQVTDEELFDMNTKTASAIWGLNNGDIARGKQADIVIAKAGNGNYLWDDLFATDPADILVIIHKGKIRLFDDTILPQLEQTNFDLKKYKPVALNGTIKYVEGDLPALINAIKSHYPKATFPCNELHLEVKARHA